MKMNQRQSSDLPEKQRRKMGGLKRILLAWAVAALAVFAVDAMALDTCIPLGNGGAYQPGPPMWWGGAGTSGFDRFNTWVDDPRWSGATSITYGDGATNELQFRALYGREKNDPTKPQNVYLSWWYKAALETSSAQNNRVYLGIAAAGASEKGLLLEVELNTLSPTTAGGAGAAIINVYPVDSTGATGGALTPLPVWANDVRVWIAQVTDQTTLNPSQSNVPEPNNWAVHVRLPLGVNLGDATHNVMIGSDKFNAWFELLEGTPGAPVIAYTWPRPTATETFYIANEFTNYRLPALSKWPVFNLPSASTVCQGITIEPADIHVTYSGSPDDWSISTLTPNTFTATPTNRSGVAIDASKVSARFRIANWGIQPGGYADPGTANWNTVRGLEAVSATGTISDGTSWTITGAPWQPDSSVPAEAGFFNGLKSDHQCIQVELSGPANMTFLKNSAFRNMRMVHASEFSGEAEVSVAGLKPAGTPKRDVYLSVQTTNMPERVPKDAQQNVAGTRIVPGTRGFILNEKADTQLKEFSIAGRQQRTPDQIAESNLERERPVFEQIARIAPTKIVRGYYDTGRTITFNGVKHPVLQSMVSFGYVVSHEGPLYGWEHSLQGAERIAADFYKVSVPNNGTAKIRTTVVAHETPRPSVPCGCGTTCAHAATLSPTNDADNQFAGTEFMWLGLAGVGMFAYARRRRDKAAKV